MTTLREPTHDELLVLAFIKENTKATFSELMQYLGISNQKMYDILQDLMNGDFIYTRSKIGQAVVYELYKYK